MNHSPDSSSERVALTPTYYEICVGDRLGLQGAIWFDDMTITVDEETAPRQTTIHGYIRDQAALYGLISRIRDLGLTLVSVKPAVPWREP